MRFGGAEGMRGGRAWQHAWMEMRNLTPKTYPGFALPFFVCLIWEGGVFWEQDGSLSTCAALSDFSICGRLPEYRYNPFPIYLLRVFSMTIIKSRVCLRMQLGIYTWSECRSSLTPLGRTLLTSSLGMIKCSIRYATVKAIPTLLHVHSKPGHSNVDRHLLP